MNYKMECCLCGNEIEKQYTPEGVLYWDQGNNAEPLKKGRCCDKCNFEKVVAERIRRSY